MKDLYQILFIARREAWNWLKNNAVATIVFIILAIQCFCWFYQTLLPNGEVNIFWGLLSLAVSLFLVGHVVVAYINRKEIIEWTKENMGIFLFIGGLIFFVGIPMGRAIFDNPKAEYSEQSTKSKTVSEYTSPTSEPVSIPDNSSKLEPTYSDERWPTTDSELLKIPKSNRWYNARKKVGSRGTIVGPVIDVHQARGSRGQPIFINIGKNYPDSDRVQVVIWGNRAHEFEDMLNDIDHGNAWVSVTGYIGKYKGVAQINTDKTSTKWLWWTDVQ